MKPSMVLVLVLVIPTPSLNSSVKNVSPSSRTATPHGDGASTLSTMLPGCDGVPQELDDTASDTPGDSTGHWSAVDVGVSPSQAASRGTRPHRSTPARAARGSPRP